jgi:carboxypeptidase C (cathepsin A)
MTATTTPAGIGSVGEQPTGRLDPNREDRLVPSHTRHQILTDSGPLDYTATAGYFDLVEEDFSGPLATEPKVTDRFFLVTYARPDQPAAHRPVVFLFNGGPGSSSVWLQLGLFGPRRVEVVDETTTIAEGYRLVDNAETLLTEADLVVINATNTGYSRVEPGTKADEFHDVVRDVESISDLIRLWITRHRRWSSPLYIAGESYGVLRGTKIAAHLAQRHGVYLAGLILISSTLGGDTMRFGPGAILGPVAFVPSYAALAHYHGVTATCRSVAAVAAEAQEFAEGDYLRALVAGHRLPPADYDRIADQVAQLIGLDPAYVRQANLRIEPGRFRAELLRSRGLIIGRIDGRFTGWNPDNAGEQALSDPSLDRVQGGYAAAINDYLREELGYANDLSYELMTERVQPWRLPPPPRGPGGGGGFDSISALAEALRTNPQLQVSYSVGYYDICTPYGGAELDLAQLPLPRRLLNNITVDHYEAGHMFYLHEPSRVAVSQRLRAFVRESNPRPR